MLANRGTYQSLIVIASESYADPANPVRCLVGDVAEQTCFDEKVCFV